MSRTKDPPLISGTQFVAIVVLTIAVFLIVDFGRRTTAGYYVSQAEKSLRAGIQAEIALRTQLEERRGNSMTDAYVEKWAREQAHMIRPGDQPLILITPQTPPRPVDIPGDQDATVTDAPVPSWYHWWWLFLDTEPGTFRRG